MADDAAAPEGELTESTGTELTGSPAEASESPQTTPQTAEATESSDSEAQDDSAAEDTPAEGDEAVAEKPRREPISHVAQAMVVGLTVVVALAGLVGWLGWRATESHRAEKQRELFVQVGRQAAINLTTIDYAEVDKDVNRILESSTDVFYDEFSKRSQPFADVVKKAQSKSVGEVTAAGLESEDNDHAQVLVAVTVKTANAGLAEQQPRLWRMRISVKKTGDDEAKVSNVEFVP